MNKNLTFNTKKDYKEYILTNSELNPSKILFLENQDFYQLITYLADNKIVYYYGLLDENKLVASGSSLLEKNSCYGSILNTIGEDVSRGSNDATERFHENVLESFDFTDINDHPIKYDQHKKTVVFIYSYKLGKLVSNISDLVEETHGLNVDYFIISIDNLSIKSLN